MSSPPGNLVDLAPLLDELRAQLAGRVRASKRPYRLGVVVEEGNVAGGSFARSLEREAIAGGVQVVHRTVPRDDAETTLTVLDALVVDPTVNGVVVVQPVQSLPAGVVAAHLPASKDVEAVTPAALSAAAEGRRRG
ncbi:MAG: hypothetical protein WBZ07_00870, partial [Candidatus Dormiibacterota bacterium]